ncbi:MAG: PLP-dependent aminotransferase family protein [Gemmatimonadetes bacterium]|nr:PLP-dependent aminotransferase family protein [Gemmatimonadota bacterium]
MTIWTPDIEHRDGPLYRAIADAIATDLAGGQLTAGERLPTQRVLADELDVALTTVTRGYAEAERRGLVSGEVGRGTFVRGGPPGAAIGPDPDAPLDLTPNHLGPWAHAQELADGIARMASRLPGAGIIDYQPLGGTERQRAAGALWMDRAGLAARSDSVLVTNGAQHSMAITFATITNPGDTVFTGKLTYSGMKSLAHLLRLKLKGLPMDGEGIEPEAFERACRAGPAKALYCMPTLHNPTGVVMPATRRKEIAAIAAEYAVPIVEDDSYGFLLPDETPLSAYANEAYYMAGTSKSLAPGLRIGFLLPPASMVDRLKAAISSTTFSVPTLMGDVVAEWIFDGTADRVMAWKRSEVAERQRLAQSLLGQYDDVSHPMSQQVWLTLPDPWCTSEFVNQAAMRGVLVSPAEDFIAGRAPPPHAVRVCLGPVADRGRLEEGLQILADILSQPPEPCQVVV